ncbi:MAG: Asp23/Gls24 family envelope stress response protein [Ruminococcaceae bacterium]|nr:Asp23/Gls24 family envelope stress response protein [Oscillospiraceae bacterium]
MAENKPYITQKQENGSIQISEEVIVSIATVAISETEGVSGFAVRTGAELVDMLNKKSRGKGIKVTITEDDRLFVTCNIIVNYGTAVVNVAKAVQENVASSVESMTGLNVEEVTVNVCGISVEQK